MRTGRRMSTRMRDVYRKKDECRMMDEYRKKDEYRMMDENLLRAVINTMLV